MRGRAAVGRHHREHLIEVEQCCVGRCQIARDEHERMREVGNARGCRAAQLSDHALRHIGEVGGTLAQVPADLSELLGELGERCVHRVFAGRAAVDLRLDGLGEGRILGHHGLRLEHVSG